jgi:hypothetical protein
LNVIHSQIVYFFDLILYQDLSTILDLIQILLLIFQLFVLSLNLLSSVFIILNKKGSWKYLGHSSWCLSSLNLVLLTLVFFLFYAIGTVVINGANVINLIANSNDTVSAASDEDTEIDIKVSADTMYLNCFKPFDKNYYPAKYPNLTETIESLDRFTNLLFNQNTFRFKEPFNLLLFINKARDYVYNITDPSTVILNKDPNDPNPFNTLSTIFNRMVDYRHSLPYQVMNNCVLPPTSFELYILKTSCSYPLIDPPPPRLADFDNAKVCLLLNHIDKNALKEYFEHKFNCDYKYGKFFETSVYDSLFEQFMGVHNILSSYYEQYKTWRDYTGDILLQYD